MSQFPQAPYGQVPQGQNQPMYPAPQPPMYGPPAAQQVAPQQYGPAPTQPVPQQYPQGGYAPPSGPAQQPGFQHPAMQQRPPMAGFGGPRNVKPDLGTMFSGIGNARSRPSTNYVRGGRYWMKIEKVKGYRAARGREGVAIEMVTLMVIDNAQGTGHRVGEACARIISNSSFRFLDDMRGFLEKTVGLPQEANEQQAMQAAMQVCDEATNPLCGTVIEVSANVITSQKTGQPFTRVDIVREVPTAEVIATLPLEVQNLYFPGGQLQRMAAIQQQAYQPPQNYLPQPGPAAYQQPQQAQGGMGYPPVQQPAPAPQYAPTGYPQQPAGGYAVTPPPGGYPAPR